MKSHINKSGIHISTKAIYIAPIVLSLLAIFPFEYEFYTFLRIVVCFSSCFATYQLFKGKDKVWILFALIALLFNPFIPVHLGSRLLWGVINVSVAVAFGWILKGLNQESG